MQTDPNAAAAAWVAALNNPTTTAKITAGVAAVTVAPGIAAANNSAAYQQNVIAAVPKWKKNVAAVPLTSWQSDMNSKGIPRIAQGATASQQKMANFMTALLPAVAAARQGLPPRGDFNANVARMTQFVTKMHAFSYTPTA